MLTCSLGYFLIFEQVMYFQHTCPAVLEVHSYRVQMEIRFNNLYKQVGYAQSLQFLSYCTQE